ncbi:hypothetical protein KSD_43370 [Ktedonobacter sp. SOSP1-85]|uniref:SDR family NAD(P)-dependent oxidoreductase n=1 Tax=Ktedonobacter sp. SOSP1-85 TaxID=2778367 RepID=UPI00191556F7|nr:SDR family NAD(P)-dependent oxidoreductase [Ktedonobacter sp. SOSP1-85]GHO76566.1 hypothetical protein KSD_43370 [Ktedonobacter sp. SOSP1-85]
MTKTLTGKRAVVTGETSGVGAGIVQYLMEEGATVLTCAHSNKARPPKTAKEMALVRLPAITLGGKSGPSIIQLSPMLQPSPLQGEGFSLC